MATMTITGKKQLSGSISIAGMKNAATPILAATLLVGDEVRVHNVPDITDVRKLLELLESLGVAVQHEGDSLVLSAAHIDPTALDQQKVKSMRSSVLLIGPLLARFGELTIPEPGGCNIGNRSLDAHIAVVEQFGGKVKKDGEMYSFTMKRPSSGTIILPEFSVTATENAVMAAVLAKGETNILQAAAEPHVQDLCNFLNACGARIRGIGTHELSVEGVKKLHGAEYAIIPDTIEVGTFAVLGALLAKKLELSPVIPEHMTAVLYKLHTLGVPFTLKGNRMTIQSGGDLSSFKVWTGPYPGFPTDLQAPFGVLATQAQGLSLIHDPMYEGRFGYAAELRKMGARVIQADPHRLLIEGKTELFGTHIKSLDLRAGITLLIASLLAEGESVIEESEIIGRGYSNIAERLRAIGADITEDNQ
ncbi:MAG: UDP-N-acetylglucosamine 1-carboxyvinyltransferase [Patescibacteria group bacterium]|jgi:UDP-N-acetylglucosamine 1-carboxyvinyltransferase